MTTQPEETSTQEPATTELVCQNGGTPNGDRCDCPVEFGGRTCYRHIRDCTEPFARGHTSDVMGQYLIHPQGAPTPFMVRCRFNNDGITYPLRRFNEESFCQDLATCTVHSGDNLETDPNPRNFFIGLENLHNLLNQATYDLHVSMMFADGSSGSAIYRNFNIGPGYTDFKISFDGYDPTSDADQGFSIALPVVFSADGIDVYGCFAELGVAGWYGTDCVGYSMFADMGQLVWPVGGTERPVEQLDFLVIRMSPLDYDE
ncbi:microfibril-associated glycoprotein 4-like [Littorina saxatilis]